MALVSKAFGDIITFTRASTATYFDATGTLQSAAINVPRFDYDPSTLAAQGLLIEEARTNSIRNNTMQGAVAGTPGTQPNNWATTTTGGSITRTIVGTGTENGIAYIDIQYVFSAGATATVQFEQGTQIAAANGQTWTQSTYVKLAGGSLTNISEIRNSIAENNAGGTFLVGSTAAFTPTTGALSGQRYTHTRTLNNASTAFVVGTTQIVATGAADITLRIGLPQLEQGAFATSVIPTTTTALTRSADVASVNTLSPWYRADEGTLFAEAQHYAPSAATAQFQAQLASASTDYYSLFKDSSPANLTARVRSGGVDSAYMYTTGVVSANTTYKNALAYAVNDFAACADGGTVQTDTSGALPTSITALGLGKATYTNAVQLNGWLRRVTYYPRRLSNAELQAITA